MGTLEVQDTLIYCNGEKNSQLFNILCMIKSKLHIIFKLILLKEAANYQYESCFFSAMLLIAFYFIH